MNKRLFFGFKMGISIAALMFISLYFIKYDNNIHLNSINLVFISALVSLCVFSVNLAISRGKNK